MSLILVRDPEDKTLIGAFPNFLTRIQIARLVDIRQDASDLEFFELEDISWVWINAAKCRPEDLGPEDRGYYETGEASIGNEDELVMHDIAYYEEDWERENFSFQDIFPFAAMGESN